MKIKKIWKVKFLKKYQKKNKNGIARFKKLRRFK